MIISLLLLKIWNNNLFQTNKNPMNYFLEQRPPKYHWDNSLKKSGIRKTPTRKIHQSNFLLAKPPLPQKILIQKILTLTITIHVFKYSHYNRYHWYYRKDFLVVLYFKIAEIRNLEVEVKKNVKLIGQNSNILLKSLAGQVW